MCYGGVLCCVVLCCVVMLFLLASFISSYSFSFLLSLSSLFLNSSHLSCTHLSPPHLSTPLLFTPLLAYFLLSISPLNPNKQCETTNTRVKISFNLYSKINKIGVTRRSIIDLVNAWSTHSTTQGKSKARSDSSVTVSERWLTMKELLLASKEGRVST